MSTPLEWDELGGALDPRAFAIRTVPKRVMRSGDPMRAMLKKKPNLGTAVAKLMSVV